MNFKKDYCGDGKMEYMNGSLEEYQYLVFLVFKYCGIANINLNVEFEYT
jgi:hypothetical protein